MKNTTEAKKEEMIREIRFLFEQIIWTMHSYDPKSDYISRCGAEIASGGTLPHQWPRLFLCRAVAH